MKTKKNISIAVLCVFVALIFAEPLYSPTWNYYLDLPENFLLQHKKGSEEYQFLHPDLNITFIIKIYSQLKDSSAEVGLKTELTKLQAKYEAEQFLWNGDETAIALFTTQLGGQALKGWANFTVYEFDKQKQGLLCFAYSSLVDFPENEQFIISALDSVSIGYGALRKPGIMTSYAYPRVKEITKNISIDNKTIAVVLDEHDAEANRFVIEREFSILKRFANTPMWKKAWQRYYRLIYRDSYERLKKASFSIYNTLFLEKVETRQIDDYTIAQTLLTWTQKMPYERNFIASDFTALPDVLLGKGSDCDSRALLLAVLMNKMNYTTSLFVSREYEHALFGIVLDHSGAKLSHESNLYLLGETTAPVNLGLVAKDMSNSLLWIGIPLEN